MPATKFLSCKLMGLEDLREHWGGVHASTGQVLNLGPLQLAGVRPELLLVAEVAVLHPTRCS